MRQSNKYKFVPYHIKGILINFDNQKGKYVEFYCIKAPYFWHITNIYILIASSLLQRCHTVQKHNFQFETVYSRTLCVP